MAAQRVFSWPRQQRGDYFVIHLGSNYGDYFDSFDLETARIDVEADLRIFSGAGVLAGEMSVADSGWG